MISKNNQESSHQINIHSKRCMQSFVMHEISEDEVRTSINNVKAHTVHGFDHIPAKFIKTAACVLTRRVARIWKRGGGFFERVRKEQTTLTRIFIVLESVSHGLSEN